MRLYMAITNDKYELPVCVADSLKELAEHFGVSVSAVASQISLGLSGRKLGHRYIKIEVEDEEAENG